MASLIVGSGVATVVALFVFMLVLDWHRSRKLWRVRYWHAKVDGPRVYGDERPTSCRMNYDDAHGYAKIFGGDVERVPKQ